MDIFLGEWVQYATAFLSGYHIIPEHLPDDCFPLCDRSLGVPLYFQWRYRHLGRDF